MQHLFEKGVNGFSLLATTALSWQWVPADCPGKAINWQESY
jgi:hypothetical protein